MRKSERFEVTDRQRDIKDEIVCPQCGKAMGVQVQGKSIRKCVKCQHEWAIRKTVRLG